MAIRQKTTIMMKVNSESPSHSLTNIKVRDVGFAIDEPVERGGTNLGPTPTETIVSALIGCTNVIGHKCAQSLDIDIGHLNIDVACEFDRRGVTLVEEIDVPFKKITMDVTYDGSATAADIDRLVAEVAKFCPLSKVFKQAGTVIEETWKQAAS